MVIIAFEYDSATIFVNVSCVFSKSQLCASSSHSFTISTAEAYNRSDSLGYDFTKSMENMTGAICSERLAQTAAALYNRFEEVAGIDEISEIKEMMLRSGALGALMTGSGSAVFGIFDDRDKASSCEDNLSRKYDEVFIVHPDRAGPQKVVPGGLIGSLLG